MKAARFFTAFFVLTISSVLLVPSVYSADLTMGDAINKAGRQRMLTQRIVKTYAMMGQDIRYRKAKKQLRLSIELFDDQLNELKKIKVNSEIKGELQAVEKLWKPMRAIATKKINKDQVIQLRAGSEKLLEKAHHVVTLLEGASESNAGQLVNIAGRQRMLTQRMANLYLLQSWGFNDEQYKNDYTQAVTEFDSALQKLKAASENTPQINKGLTQVEQLWQLFKLSDRMKEDKFIPTLVTRSLDKILTRMNDITGQYAELLK